MSSLNWTKLFPLGIGPGSIGDFGRVCDTHNNAPVLFGGDASENGGTLSNTAIYNVTNNKWINPTIYSTPTAREFCGITYDSSLNLTILYGGSIEGNVIPAVSFNDMWTFNSTSYTWTQLTPSTYPGDLCYHTMTYSAKQNMIYLYGGDDLSSTPLSNLWTYTIFSNEWDQITPVSPFASILNNRTVWILLVLSIISTIFAIISV